MRDAAQAALHLEIKTQIGVGNREQTGQGLDGAVHGLGHQAGVAFRFLQSAESVVSGEEFVPAIAAQRHRHMAAGEAAEQPGGQQRVVALGFIQLVENLRQDLAGFVQVELLALVSGLQKIGRAAGKGRLVIRRLGKSHAESPQPSRAHVPDGQGGDGGGIDPATQEHAQRHVGHEAALDRAIQPLQQFLGQTGLAALRQRFVHLERQ